MCDTLVALRDATADGSVIFAKNSDRPRGEGQSVRHYPRGAHGLEEAVRCTYIEIPQADVTHAVLLSQIDWMWGAEMGANEHGVVIGNEAVWTREQLGPAALLGMDLVRLGLERGETARDALNVITDLLKKHGQGGACGENDPSFAYHNGFLIADPSEAWVLETADRYWAAERISSGTRNISNGLSIRDGWELASSGVPPGTDFAGTYSVTPVNDDPASREGAAKRMLERSHGSITPETMMDALADHDSGICMHGMFETTASQVSRLTPDGECEHWMTGRAHPCQSPFHRVTIDQPVAAAQ